MTPPLAVCAPDKLRGALDAPGAAAALAAGARAAGWDAVEHPLADGGEGTLDVLLAARGGERIAVAAVDALGRPCEAEVGLLPDGTAVVETAVGDRPRAARGGGARPAARVERRRGAAGARGARRGGPTRIVLCLGGSASVDGGLGLLAGLGAGRPRRRRATTSPAPAPTSTASRCWSAPGLDARLDGRRADRGRGRDQPADRARRARHRCSARRRARRPPRWSSGSTPAWPGSRPLLGAAADVEGAGAAGGLGAACAWLGAAVVPGAGLVIAETGLPALLDGAALCLTAEGRIDASTLAGKTVARVVEASVAAGVPCVAIGGALGPGHDGLYGLGAAGGAGGVVGSGRPCARRSTARRRSSRGSRGRRAGWSARTPV